MKHFFYLNDKYSFNLVLYQECPTKNWLHAFLIKFFSYPVNQNLVRNEDVLSFVRQLQRINTVLLVRLLYSRKVLKFKLMEFIKIQKTKCFLLVSKI